MRCTHVPHSPHADFFKCAEMLVAEADIRKISPPVLQEMEGGWLVLVCVRESL